MGILIGTDGSLESQIPEAILAKLPGFRRQAIDVLSVAVPPMYFANFGMPMPMDAFGDVLSLVQKAGKTAASEAATRLKAAGFTTVVPHVQLGSAAERLMEFATLNQSSLIAVGSHGRGGFAAMLMGSVARHLVSASPTDLLLGRVVNGSPGGTIENLRRKTKLRLLVAVDGSEGSRAAIDRVRAHSDLSFEEIIVVCVDPVLLLPPGVDAASFDRLFDEGKTQAVAIVEAAEKLLEPCATSVLTATITGRPSEEINKLAAERAVDLIVLGATRHSTVSRILLGSVSYEVASQAPCSCYLVRP